MDFEKARFNMVEQQIRPWDVLNTQVLDLLFHVKREEFVSDKQKTIAFVDTELPPPPPPPHPLSSMPRVPEPSRVMNLRLSIMSGS